MPSPILASKHGIGQRRVPPCRFGVPDAPRRIRAFSVAQQWDARESRRRPRADEPASETVHGVAGEGGGEDGGPGFCAQEGDACGRGLVQVEAAASKRWV